MQLYESESWWAEHRSVVQATRWLAEIDTAISGLNSEAGRHPLAREAESFNFPLHQMNFGVSGSATHRVLYSFDDVRVLVYAVRHLSQSEVVPIPRTGQSLKFD